MLCERPVFVDIVLSGTSNCFIWKLPVCKIYSERYDQKNFGGVGSLERHIKISALIIRVVPLQAVLYIYISTPSCIRAHAAMFIL